MWSLGMIFYFMITGRLIYEQIDDIDILKREMLLLKRIVLPRDSSKLPKIYRDVLSSLLALNSCRAVVLNSFPQVSWPCGIAVFEYFPM